MKELTGESLSLFEVFRVSQNQLKVGLSKKSRELMTNSRKFIDQKAKSGEVMYGVNTGFGAFSSVIIPQDQIIELQKNLIRSHCVGVGEVFTREQTRAMLLLRANALARGHSGIRPEVVDKLLEFLSHDILPWIPQQGSVGASGDLAPLAHLALSIIGEGWVWSETGDRTTTAEVLKKKNVLPLELQAKEGLSMINGCQVMTAVGLLGLYQWRNLLLSLDIAGAISLEALRGSRSAFNPLIAATRPHPGEAQTARNLIKILGVSSSISESHKGCNKVQDAYSLRCMPAVHGAAKDTWNYAHQVLVTEANSSTDNPLVFADTGEILSCGNFHGEPVAFALDFAAIATSAAANISECRIEKLINPAMSDLPAFLAPNGGLNSGHMIVQVAAASLVSENKILSHPASVDSIPTSADKEDHVSMGTISARKFQSILNNAENILAMEFLSGCQALDLLRPLQPSAGVLKAYELIRERAPFAQKDRVFSEDIFQIKQLIHSGKILTAVESAVGALEIERWSSK